MTTVRSGDSGIRVVPALTGAEHGVLLDSGVAAVQEALHSGRRVVPDASQFPARLRLPGSSFVTLRRQDRLLGCIGALEPYQALGCDVVEHALAAAFADPRFPGIGVDDFEQMDVEISVLGPLVPLDVGCHRELRDLLRPGADGLVVAAPGHRATFLPSVWSQVRDVDDFCALLWRKAGLRPGSWPPGLVLSRYRVDEFGRPGPRPFTG